MFRNRFFSIAGVSLVGVIAMAGCSPGPGSTNAPANAGNGASQGNTANGSPGAGATASKPEKANLDTSK